MRTELGMDPTEFEDYQVGIDGDVTFCLKELRASVASWFHTFFCKMKIS